MARFLSSEWFEEVERHSPPGDPAPPGNPTDDQLVLRQVVRATPDGDISYLVVVSGRVARLRRPKQDGPNHDGPGPDLTITTDWDTATAIAQGKLSTQSALMEGRLRLNGNLARLSGKAAELAGLDPVPPEVRDSTTY